MAPNFCLGIKAKEINNKLQLKEKVQEELNYLEEKKETINEHQEVLEKGRVALSLIHLERSINEAKKEIEANKLEIVNKEKELQSNTKDLKESKEHYEECKELEKGKDRLIEEKSKLNAIIGRFKDYKQKEISMESMEIFVPLAYNLGVYQLKCELEDLSLKYLLPDEYKRVSDETNKLLDESKSILEDMAHKIGDLLNSKDIPNEIKIRIRNIYGIYRKRYDGQAIKNIHDLLALKVIVDEISDCYTSLGYVHSLYKPINSKFKDYICNPKTNMYQCLHTTVFGPDNMLVQAQIRTLQMDKIDSYGIAAYWDLDSENASKKMLEIVENKSQFFKSLVEIDEQYQDNKSFIDQVKKELFSGNVYVYTTEGKVLQLPVGSTPVDFAYRLDPLNASRMVQAIVNDRKVADDYILQNKDRVRILTNRYGIPKKEWEDKVKTTRALALIKKDLS